MNVEPNFVHELLSLQSINNDAVFFTGKQPTNYLSLLLHLSRYSNLLLTVTGPKGSGKTHLKKQFIKQIDSGVKLLNLNANQIPTALSLLTVISEKIEIETFASSDTDYVLEEVRNYCTSLNEEGGSFLIVIDEAELLDSECLDLILELATLSNSTVNKDSFRPHIALFGEASLLRKLNSPENKSRYEKVAHHLPLEAFSPEQSKAYLKHRCQSVGINNPPFTDAEMLALHTQAQGLPGPLNDALIAKYQKALDSPRPMPDLTPEPLSKGKKPVKKQNKIKPSSAPKAKQDEKQTKRKVPLWLLVALVSTLGFFILGLLYKDDVSTDQDNQVVIEEDWQPLTDVTETNLNRLDEMAAALEQQRQEAAVSTQLEEVELVEVEQPSTPPTQVTPPKQTEVVTPPAQLDLPDDTPALVQTPTVETPPKQTQQVTPPKTSQTTPVWRDTGFKREASLMKKNPKHFTLQLVGSQDEAKLRELIEELNKSSQTQLSYLESRRNGSPWFVLVTGDYPNIEAARAAIPNLDAELRRLGPWARDFQSVQDLIRNK